MILYIEHVVVGAIGKPFVSKSHSRMAYDVYD